MRSFFLLLGSAGVLAFFAVRLLPCGLCDGAFVRKKEAAGPGWHVDSAACPDCKDSGRVRLLAWLGQETVDPRLHRLLHTPPQDFGASPANRGLIDLLQENRAAPRFFPLSDLDAGVARFSADAVLVTGYALQKGTLPDGPESGQVWLFDRRGRLLDSLAMRTTDDEARLHLWFLGKEEADFRLQAHRRTYMRLSPSSSLKGVKLWRQDVGDLDPAGWFSKADARVGVRGGRFVPLPPGP